MITEGYKSNFETLKRAADDGNLAIMDCQDKVTGEQVIVICAVGFDGVEYQLVPLAKMFNGNPFDELNPPLPDGGYANL